MVGSRLNPLSLIYTLMHRTGTHVEHNKHLVVCDVARKRAIKETDFFYLRKVRC